MNSLMEKLAKPSGITYRDHRQHVYEEAEMLLSTHPFWSKKYAELTNQDMPAQVKRAAWWHDAGKTHPKWSDACQKDYEKYREWRQENNLPPDEINAADYKCYEANMRRNKMSSGPNLLKAAFRHEFDSLKKAINHFKENDPLTLAERVAIAAHHGKLGERFRERWQADGKEKNEKFGPYSYLWTDLEGDSKYAVPEGKAAWENKVKERYKIAGVRAILRLADTRASRIESGESVPELAKFSYDFPHPELNDVQRIAEKMASNPDVSILRATTGSGKTDGALLWGKKQIVDYKRADRMVIAMPTRFTSNALAINVQENISSTGLYHSSAWYNRYGNVTLEEKGNAKELHKLAQYLATPVTVCTIDHLLLSLTGTKEDHHTSFFFLANSAVVFDEADFYDPFVQANLLVLLETLRILKVPVLIMSATIPDSSKSLYGVDNIQNMPADSKPAIRSIVWRGPAETPEDVAGILKGMVRQRTGIVYANTVDRAHAYYQWFMQEHERGGPKPILYHSRYTEPDKKNIEEKLIGALGKEAWKKEGQQPKGIAILTQIGEMSINISAPIMLSDICPWDRLAQRAGRLDRFNLSPNGGILYVVEPLKEGILYPAPYGEYQRKNGWVAANAFTQTLLELKNTFDEVPQYIQPNDFVDWVNGLYPSHSEFENKIKQNRDKLKGLMNHNWMIVSGQHTDQDEVSVTGHWKSRDIPPQETVFIEMPESGQQYDGKDRKAYPFHSWDEFRTFQLEFGISCPVYMTEKAKKFNQLIPFQYTIGDDQIPNTLWIVAPGIYKPETGLALLGKGEVSDRSAGITI
jgi:CRISPR-associated endonuclease/helicase Cas3